MSCNVFRKHCASLRPKCSQTRLPTSFAFCKGKKIFPLIYLKKLQVTKFAHVGMFADVIKKESGPSWPSLARPERIVYFFFSNSALVFQGKNNYRRFEKFKSMKVLHWICWIFVCQSQILPQFFTSTYTFLQPTRSFCVSVWKLAISRKCTPHEKRVFIFLNSLTSNII